MKRIDFPKEELATLSKRDVIITHRVSDDFGKFKLNDIVITPWNEEYKVTGLKVIHSIDESPFKKDLTNYQYEFLNDFNDIAVIRLENVDKLLNESKSPILNSLEKLVGHERIFNDKIDFMPTTSIMNQMFNVLNRGLFNNRLPSIDVLCISSSEIQDIFNKYQHKKDPKSFYALYFPIIDWNKITYLKKNQTPSINYLIVNTDNFPVSFSFAISQLCHEMIHYLDTIKGDILFKFKEGFKNGIIENEHNTKIFMNKTNDINKTGISIFPDDGGFSSDELNQLCINRIKKLEEDINNNDIDFTKFMPKAMIEANVDKNGNIIAISF